jgi:SAM-dependent MidA family methyltransferase
MEAALYHPDFGYYARAVQRSGRAGDFFTSVDVGPLFGELLARQIAEMADVLADLKVGTTPVGRGRPSRRPGSFDLIEAGAGNGRLTADILRALKRDAPGIYETTNVHLVEASAEARAVQRGTLGESVDRLSLSSAALPESFEGVLIANELLDAMPVHQVVMREDGLREVYVESGANGLRLREGPLSTPRLAAYFADLEIQLEPGWRAELSLAAVDWVRDAARRLKRGFIVLIDYGHEAAELYSVTHSTGTLTTFARHRSAGPETAMVPWLRNPGEQDLTAHVDFTSVRRAAEAEGCTMLGFSDQMYFLMALVTGLPEQAREAGDAAREVGDAAREVGDTAREVGDTAREVGDALQGVPQLEALSAKQRLAFKTLMMPGGLGSTMKVMIFGKNVGSPRLAGLSSHMRVT